MRRTQVRRFVQEAMAYVPSTDVKYALLPQPLCSLPNLDKKEPHCSHLLISYEHEEIFERGEPGSETY
jgi:hypothetical protein